jgi:cyclic-di-GMP-binding protein
MPSFDVVSKTDLQEVDNALNSVCREIGTRYDFKGSNASIERKEETITINADDNYKLEAIQDMLKVHITRRNLDTKALEFKDPKKAAGNTLRQEVIIKQGIESDIAKKIVKAIKDAKMKVQASIRADELRIEGKKRDDLQDAIAFIKKLDIELPLQYINFRD